MCACNPAIKTPWCGQGDCQPPAGPAAAAGEERKLATGLRDLHWELGEIQRKFGYLRQLVSDGSTDTVFALGEAMGTIGKVKALVGRDIDQGRAA